LLWRFPRFGVAFGEVPSVRMSEQKKFRSDRRMRLAPRHQQDPGRHDFLGWNCHVADNLLADDSVGLRGGLMPCRLA
jgi:hypothetical protein